MNSLASVTELLKSGLEKLKIRADCDLLLHYLTLLEKWNKTYNLTAVRNLESMVSRHLLECLAIRPFVKGERLLDIGTGAGLPGIPLAICEPQLHVVLLDSNGKKIRFLQEVQRQLKLPNLEIVQSRVESYHKTPGFDTLTTRAFSDLAQMIDLSHHLIAKNGIWLAMKGHYPETELANIHLPYQVQSYSVPGLDSKRCCVIIDNSNKE